MRILSKSITKLDSSGEAKLRSKTLTFTIEVPKKDPFQLKIIIIIICN